MKRTKQFWRWFWQRFVMGGFGWGVVGLTALTFFVIVFDLVYFLGP
jgi:hypothetical protein